MTKASLIVYVLSAVALATSCGGGSHSGGGSEGKVVDVNSCIDYHVSSVGSLGFFEHLVTNTCDFDVNFGWLLGGLGRATIPGGQTVRLTGAATSVFDTPVPFIACRPPAVPLQNRELFCFGG